MQSTTMVFQEPKKVYVDVETVGLRCSVGPSPNCGPYAASALLY